MGFIVFGLLLLARTPVDATYATDLLPAMLLIGLGAGLGFPSLMTLAMSGATERDSGLASGLVNTSVQVGGAIGLAVLATVATERTDRLLADGESAASALNSGYHLAYLIGAGLVLVATAVAVSVLRPPAPEAAAESVPAAPVPEVAAESVPAAPVPEVIPEPAEAAPIRAIPLPADVAPGVGCVETGMRVTIGCGGCAAASP
jgi:MFS family permease